MIEMENFLLIGLLVIGLLSWLAFSFYALWRAGKMFEQKQQLERTSRFYESVLYSLFDRPIWLWADETITADDVSLAFLGLSGPVTTLDDLVSDEEFSGCSPEALEQIKQSIERGVEFSGVIEVYLGPNRPGAFIDIQMLTNPEPGLPIAVLWVEEMRSEPVDGGVATKRDDRVAAGLKRLIDALPFPVWQRDSSMRLEKVNAAYVEAVEGDTAKKVIQNNIELIETTGNQSFKRLAKEVLKTGKTVNKTQYSIINGKRRALSVTNAAIRETSSIVGVAVDITGQEEAYSELNRVLDAQSETLNRLQSPVAIFGPDQILRFYNNAFLRFSQLPEEFLSKEPSQSELFDGLRDRRRLPEEANYPAWKKMVLDIYNQLIEPYEEFWYLSDGTTHRILAQPQPLGGLMIVLEDVSDRLALERSYNTLIAVQKETLDRLHDGVGVFGSDGRLKLFNPAFCTLWNMKEEQLEGEPHFDKILKSMPKKHSRTTENWKKLWKEHDAPALGRELSEGRLFLNEDSIVDYTMVPLPDGAVMMRLTDMTATIGIQDALEERNEALETADRLKSKFITNMSYELRTPLNSIIGFSEMLQAGVAGAVSDKQASYLGDILDASGELKHMISDVLDLAVIEAGGMVLDVKSFKVNDLVNDLLLQAAPRIQDRGVEVILQSGTVTGNLEGDRQRILQTLYNLLINALMFSVKGSTVQFSVVKDKSEGTISFNFEDEQISLLEEEWDKVMDAFQHGSVVGTRGGLGLDLALVRSFVELHSGRVELTGGADEGFKISCILPLKQSR